MHGACAPAGRAPNWRETKTLESRYKSVAKGDRNGANNAHYPNEHATASRIRPHGRQRSGTVTSCVQYRSKKPKLPNGTQMWHRQRQRKEHKRPVRHTTRPQRHENNKKNTRSLDDAQRGPDDTARNKKYAWPGEASTEQGQGHDNRTNISMNTGRQERQYLQRMTMLIKDIRKKLSIRTIPAIICELTYKAINKVRKVLYKNSAPWTLGAQPVFFKPNETK